MNEAIREALLKAARESQTQLAVEVIQTAEEQQRFEEAKLASQSVGHDYYLLTCLPTAAALTSLKSESLIEKWQSLKAQFQSFAPDQQVELVSQIATGMRISEDRADPLYKQAFRVEESIENSDYLVTAMSRLFRYNLHQTESFYNFMRTHQLGRDNKFPEICSSIAAWIRVHPE